MPHSETNLAEHSGSLLESHKGYDPRVIFFYFVIAALLLTLAGGLGYQQLFQTDTYNERERVQSQRRILVPGPRGNIYARDGTTVLVGNRPRFSVVIYLDELKPDFLQEARVIRRNYTKAGMTGAAIRDVPFARIARVSVVQRYLDQVNKILGRNEQVDDKALTRHFGEELLLPFKLIEDLTEHEYARLIEHLPVRSPVQVYTSSTRHYPNGSTAAHALGYVGVLSNVEAEGFPGEDLGTFRMPGSIGKAGLEKSFDAQLQGEAGGTIFRVDPNGYKINPPLEKRLPVQGKNIVSSLDLDLQRTAEKAIGDQVGAAVALDVRTGEVLTMVSKPDYDLNVFYPRLSHKTYAEIQSKGAELNRALSGLYPPGSTFKILTSIAGLRAGKIAPDASITTCAGTVRIGGRTFFCDNGRGQHGEVTLADAIAHSCDIYYYEAARLMTPDVLAAEGRRFHFDQPTGINLPFETRLMVMPDPAYKEKRFNEKWFPGDTANTSIGQGYVLVTPLEMACFTASVARNEVSTKPTLIHDPLARPQRSEPSGLTPAQRHTLVEGMVGTVNYGSAAPTLNLPAMRIPGVRIAGKTGTAQLRARIDGEVGTINIAWFICFAPADNPEIAIAVALEGDTLGETFGGGRHAGPVAQAILKTYFEKKNRPAPASYKIN